MKIHIKWYFDIISEVGNDITLTISVGFPKNENDRSLIHVMAGKIWDIEKAIENLNLT